MPDCNLMSFSQHVLGHGENGREAAKRNDADRRDIPESLRDVGPNGFIAQESRQQQQRLLHRRTLVNCQPSL